MLNYLKANLYLSGNATQREVQTLHDKILPFFLPSPLSPSSDDINSRDCARGICLRSWVGLPLGDPGRDRLVVLSASLLFSFKWLQAFMGDCTLLILPCEVKLLCRCGIKGDIFTVSSIAAWPWLLRASNKEFWREGTLSELQPRHVCLGMLASEWGRRPCLVCRPIASKSG